MTIPRDLLTEFVARYPAQPATALFRAIEIDVLAKAMAGEFTEGRQPLGLDLGCGDGILTDILFKRIGVRPRLVGIDIDPLETEAARSYDFYQRLHTCPAGAISEPAASFDYVISNSVLEHIPDLSPVMAEVGRLLKPNGRFFFTVPGPGMHGNLAGSMTGRSRAEYLADFDRRLAHVHYLSRADWQALCAPNGLTLDSADGYIDRAETQRWETLSRFTGGMLHRLGRGQARPIEIQRKLGMRAFQNRLHFPRPLASALGQAIVAGVTPDGSANDPSCLMVIGHR